ncbi:LysR family transcriptional regulator [Brevirhabdus pacifica]|uniref:LysR family transcriptional regulator n=1 Tax=Brevirhabdus pacifica TaxID=1267768 RepID=A0A1U7DL21_9RHOB|nr:LysR family transcriptional regulator [Brevirhabdus pacifica]APX90717.1 LysR family transcriptional regulator [Brevirhabdus pacifica]OWU78310.1 LysR family transcriptional regulator [Loktanella sp. 22II-4b]PJJ85127.1 DNA-binding transcriptional LysR family regulator [Brevirhabdus pacifica]
MLNWDDMRVFLAVARAESLSGAGKQLTMDPATVGRRIARLEEGMAATLFVKSPQGYALTETGQRILEHANRAEQALIGADDAVRGPGDALSGTIRLGAPDGCANFLLPQVCARIGEAHPELDIQIVALPRVVNLSKREVDMAIAVSPPASGRLTVQKICDYHLYLAAMPFYLKNSPPVETIEDLKDHRIIGYIPDMIFDRELDYLSGLGISQPDLASNSVAVQFQWVRMGSGIGIVHGFALRHAPRMRLLLEDQFSLTRSFYLVRHEDDRKVNRLNRLAELLVEEVRREMLELEPA